jgi:hypothetical protein
MTKTELIGTNINRDFVLGAWTRFIHEVLLDRDVIDGTTRTGLTDTVGTRGAVMYFFPIFYRAVMASGDTSAWRDSKRPRRSISASKAVECLWIQVFRLLCIRRLETSTASTDNSASRAAAASL